MIYVCESQGVTVMQITVNDLLTWQTNEWDVKLLKMDNCIAFFNTSHTMACLKLVTDKQPNTMLNISLVFAIDAMNICNDVLQK